MWKPAEKAAVEKLAEVSPMAAQRILDSDEFIVEQSLRVERQESDLEFYRERIRELEGTVADLREQVSRSVCILMGKEA